MTILPIATQRHTRGVAPEPDRREQARLGPVTV